MRSAPYSRKPTMKTLPTPSGIRTAEEYDGFLKTLYKGAKARVEEIQVPAVRVIRVEGNEPPGSEQYQQAISVLYGIAYTLKMGLKLGKLEKPPRYFDFTVGALETLWWSVGKQIEIGNAKTLRWQAYLMVPDFVTRKLFNEARRLAQVKHPELPYELAALATFHEGPCVQTLHVGPYDQEGPTIQALHDHIAANNFAAAGKHHEIYLSDPGRTKPEKLKTVIRQPVKARRARARRSA